MKIKTILILLALLIIAALFTLFYIHEEKRVDAAESHVLKIQTEKREAVKEVQEKMAALNQRHTRQLGEAIALFVRPSVEARRTDLLTAALQDAIVTLPLEEIVITDDSGSVLATTNLKYSRQVLKDEEITQSLTQSKVLTKGSYIYIPAGKTGVVRVQ